MERSFQTLPYLVDFLSSGVSRDWANHYLTWNPGSGLPDEIVRPLRLAVAEEDPIRSCIEEQFTAITVSQQMESDPILRIERITLRDHNRVGLFAIIDNQEVPAVSKRDDQQDKPSRRQHKSGNRSRRDFPHYSIIGPESWLPLDDQRWPAHLRRRKFGCARLLMGERNRCLVQPPCQHSSQGCRCYRAVEPVPPPVTTNSGMADLRRGTKFQAFAQTDEVLAAQRSRG